MAVNICPHCNQPFMADAKSGDYVHQCNSGNKALDEEDVPVSTVTAKDYGQEVTTGKLQASITKQGLANKSAGTLAAHEGHKTYDYTIRGNRAATHRQRAHREYILEVKNGK